MNERSECSLSEDDVRYLTAAAINLYHESLRRDGRGILAPQDVPVLYELIAVITHPVQVTSVPREARALSETERDSILASEASASVEPTELPQSLRRFADAR